MSSPIRKHDFQYAMALLFPFFIFTSIFFVYALLRTFGFSFTDYNMFDKPNFVGISNYLSLLKEPLFLRATTNTIIYSLVTTSIQTVLGLTLAILVNQQIRGLGFFRTVFYIPAILSSAAVSLIFMWIYQKEGYLNQFLSLVVKYSQLILVCTIIFLVVLGALFLRDRKKGYPVKYMEPANAIVAMLVVFISVFLFYLTNKFTANPEAVPVSIGWLSSGKFFLGMPIPLWAITIQNIYTSMASVMLIFLASLQMVPQSRYEAAELDGAVGIKKHLFITIPSIMPTIYLVITLSLIGTLKVFDQIALYGESGVPLQSRISLAYYVYENTFPSGGEPRIGIAAAASMILGLITIAVLALQRLLGIRSKGIE